MSIFAYQSKAETEHIQKNIKKLDELLIPTVLYNAVSKRDLKATIKVYEQNSELCKQLMRLFQGLKLSYESYSNHLCRCNLKIPWNCEWTVPTTPPAHSHNSITFYYSVYLQRYMIQHGIRNSYMYYISYTLGKFLQTLKLTKYLYSINRISCPVLILDWLADNGFHQFCNSTNVNEKDRLKLKQLYNRYGI